MKSKLFLAILLVFVVLSGMFSPVIEGVCNYNDGGDIGVTEQSGKYTTKCYGIFSRAGACENDFGADWVFANKEKKCESGGFDAHYLCKKKKTASLGTYGAPVINRTDDACNEAGRYENESKLEKVQEKLNELKNISAKVKQNIFENAKGIQQNSLASSQLKGAVGSSDMSAEDKQAGTAQDSEICKKYPVSC
jgi:hypothetical protein